MADGQRSMPTPEQWTRFLDLLSEGYTAKHAARMAGLSHQTPYNRRMKDAEFRAAWDAALATAAQRRRGGKG
jgi:hypothetical protein